MRRKYYRQNWFLYNPFKTAMFNLFCADDNKNCNSLLDLFSSLLTMILSKPGQIQAKEQVNCSFCNLLVSSLVSDQDLIISRWVVTKSDITFLFDSLHPISLFVILFISPLPPSHLTYFLNGLYGTICDVMKSKWLKLLSLSFEYALTQ